MNGRMPNFLIALALLVLPQMLQAAPLWSDVSTTETAVSVQAKTASSHSHSRRVAVDYPQLVTQLSAAPLWQHSSLQKQLAPVPLPVQVDLPMPYGGLQTYNVYDSPVMEPALAAKYPQIRTYKIISVDNPVHTGRLDTGPNGFHAYLRSAEGDVFIDPVSAGNLTHYYSYYKRDYASDAAREFSCGVSAQNESQSPVEELKNAELLTAARTSTSDKISYRIAIAATGEYTQAVGGTVLSAHNAIITALNRVNQIYETDLAITLTLVDNNDDIIYTSAATDPYTDPSNAPTLLDENQATLDDVIGNANYDIGHVVSTSGGGLAGLGVACWDSYKARGESGLSNPTGDPFYIDILAHEIGHQLGANHSFNGTTESCAYNRNAETAFEPGSGSSIMAYAGICGAENIAEFSDATFHAGSIAEIVRYTRTSTGKNCAAALPGQAAPVANAGSDYIIPGGTAFALIGSATDPEGDALSYQWSQMDAGSATTASTLGTDIGSNALFRSFEPVATPERSFPRLATLLSNSPDIAETLPTQNRTLHFRFTARDGNGGVDEDDMQIVVNGSAGPFEILQPNTGVILNSAQSQSIQWNAACTETGTVNCANVDILLSTDGGNSYSSLVGGTTPNDGVETVSLPNVNTSDARIKIACTSNIFFDISDVDFAISTADGGSLPTTVIGGSYDCGTATGVISGDDIEPNNYPAQAQTLVLPVTINGTINSVQDPDDFFVFIAQAVSYTFILSNYGDYDLDLYLLDSTGKNIIASSESIASPSEIISKELLMGNTYYLVVNGFDTNGQDTGYTLTAQSTITRPGGDSGALNLYALLLLLTTPLLRRRRTVG